MLLNVLIKKKTRIYAAPAVKGWMISRCMIIIVINFQTKPIILLTRYKVTPPRGREYILHLGCTICRTLKMRETSCFLHYSLLQHAKTCDLCMGRVGGIMAFPDCGFSKTYIWHLVDMGEEHDFVTGWVRLSYDSEMRIMLHPGCSYNITGL